MEHAGVINSSRFFHHLTIYLGMYIYSCEISNKQKERETYLVLNFQLDTFFLNRSCSNTRYIEIITPSIMVLDSIKL